MLLLMVKERHHLKAHLTDESMWGSEFGGASRRSVGSRMSNQSFDKYDCFFFKFFFLKIPQAQKKLLDEWTVFKSN